MFWEQCDMFDYEMIPKKFKFIFDSRNSFMKKIKYNNCINEDIYNRRKRLIGNKFTQSIKKAGKVVSLTQQLKTEAKTLLS